MMLWQVNTDDKKYGLFSFRHCSHIQSGKDLSDCVLSICNQTYTNLEIILVDDGSPDNCGQMCDEFAKMMSE